ncbi:MAG: sigma-70 family RNA polymerase sigma factor, partial [Defluviitaleaceae bacterium]|nr:sigma-70 family RNA polymerase sigma factor [Defluviitaleaceae bacterium]
NEILMHIRSSKKHSGDLFLQDTIGVDGDGNEVKIEDKLADGDKSTEDLIELKMKVALLYDKLHRTLKKREQMVIILRYGLKGCEELTQREIAKMMGISRSYVSRIEKKALKKLFKELGTVI